MTKNVDFHPACKLFPKLNDSDLQELAEDIKANGLQNPIVLLDGEILDGRNRFAACKLAGVDPQFKNWDGEGSPVEWIISQNLKRRHLTPSQKAVVAFELLPLLEKEAKQRQRLSKGRGKKGAQECATFSSSGKSSEAAGRIARSSPRNVEMVKEVHSKAPELIEKIRSGDLNVQEGSRLAKLPAGKRANLLRQIEQGDNGSKMPHVRELVGTGRKSLESYSTPPHVTEALLTRESFRGNVLEPCCGDGAMVEVIEENGHQVVPSDIATGHDFFEMTESVPNIVTNPPFSVSQEFVEHAKKIATNKIAMLLQLSFLETVARYPLFQDRTFPLKVVYVFCRRLKFGNTPQHQSAPMAIAWFVWHKQHEGGATLDWIE